MKVRWFLEKLQREGMIELEGGRRPTEQAVDNIKNSESGIERNANRSRFNNRSKGRLPNTITICNYNIYQAVREIDVMMRSQFDNRFTTGSQPVHSQFATGSQPDLKKGKKVEEGEEGEGERSAASPTASLMTGELALDGVEVNCVAIHGPGFVLPFEALDLTAGVLNLDVSTGRKIAEAQARAWAAEGKVPDSPIALVTAAMRSHADSEDKKRAAVARAEKRAQKEANNPATALPADWRLSKEWGTWAVEKFGLSREQVLSLAEGFKEYFTSGDAKEPLKTNWKAAWQRWVRTSVDAGRVPRALKPTPDMLVRPDDVPEPIWQEHLSRMVAGKQLSRQDAVAAGWMGR